MKKIVVNTEVIVGGRTFFAGDELAQYQVADGISFDAALGAVANGTASVVVDDKATPQPSPIPTAETAEQGEQPTQGRRRK